MFTGIIEETGSVRSIQKRKGYQRTTIDAERVLQDIQTGDSISIDGTCHTVVEHDESGFVVESVEETLQQTTLGRLQPDHRVNLERSFQVGQRIGGHMVAGHVDGIGRVLDRVESPDNVLLRIEMPAELAPYVAKKGSVAVDGISLTVVSVSDSDFTVTVIPHTLSVTTLSERKPGDPVNLEVDMLARYVERLLNTGRVPEGDNSTQASG